MMNSCKSEKPKVKHNNVGVSSRELREYGSERLDFILALFSSVLADAVNINSSYRCRDSARDYLTIKTRLGNEGLGFISKTLPRLLEELFKKLEGGVPSYTGFKLTPGTEYPAFLGRLFNDVYANGDKAGTSFGIIYQICNLFKKLKGPFLKSVYRKELRSFVDTDVSIGRINYLSEPIRAIIDDARQLINTIFELRTADGPIPGQMLPRPGPGATNTPVDKHMRYRPHVLYTDLDEEFGYFDFYESHTWSPVEGVLRYNALPRRNFATSRFKFVHKYLGKPRGICIEENEMQFFQQAIKSYMTHRLERHPATKGRVNFTHQSINRNLAMDASADRLLATIDMSSASDRVARELVYRLFRDTWVGDMLDTVSTRVITLPDRSQVFAHKFAPMGSGVCFPTMAVVHWALICSIIKQSSVLHADEAMEQVYVYGDDIVLPSRAVQAVYDYLPLFGMKINTDKSFVNGPFRESCGVHAYNGVDVTPVYVNHALKQTQSKDDVTTLLSLIAKESQFYERGFLKTSQCIQTLVHKHYWLLPTVGRESPVLGWKREGRSDLCALIDCARSCRDNVDLMTFELNLQCVVPRTGPIAHLSHDDAYLRKLVTSAQDSLYMPGSVEEMKIIRRWINETAL